MMYGLGQSFASCLFVQALPRSTRHAPLCSISGKVHQLCVGCMQSTVYVYLPHRCAHMYAYGACT